MFENFVKKLMEKINTIKTAYYEEAPNNAVFPYLVVPVINIINLNSGYSALIDIEINSNSDAIVSTESIIDNLKNELDGYSFCNNNISFYLAFENIYSGKASDQDLLYKKITFEARIFEK